MRADLFDRLEADNGLVEEMFVGTKNLDEVIIRLKAFEKVGAHVVYATGLTAMEQVLRIKAEVREAPLNVMALKMLNAQRLIEAGVKRVSLGPWFHRAAMQGLLDAITEVQSAATFTFAARTPTGADLAKMLK